MCGLDNSASYTCPSEEFLLFTVPDTATPVEPTVQFIGVLFPFIALSSAILSALVNAGFVPVELVSAFLALGLLPFLFLLLETAAPFWVGSVGKSCPT